MEKEITRLLESAKAKLEKSMDEGPDGPDAVLTAAEATVVWRLLFERTT